MIVLLLEGDDATMTLKLVSLLSALLLISLGASTRTFSATAQDPALGKGETDRERGPDNPHCVCKGHDKLKMRTFSPTVGKKGRWRLAEFDICNTNAMDPPTVTIDWGDNGSEEFGAWQSGSPDIFGTHTYMSTGTFNVTVTMKTTCHYKGADMCDYPCTAAGKVNIRVAAR
jgi:hypothetical protein